MNANPMGVFRINIKSPLQPKCLSCAMIDAELSLSLDISYSIDGERCGDTNKESEYKYNTHGWIGSNSMIAFTLMILTESKMHYAPH